MSYVHAGVFVPVFDFVNTPQQFIFSPSGNAAAKLQYWDENAYVSELLVSKPEEDKLAKAGESRSKSAADLAAAAAAKEGIVETGEEVEAKSKKRKTETKDQSKPKKVSHEVLLAIPY